MTDAVKTKAKTERVVYDKFSLGLTEEKGALSSVYSLNCSVADNVLQRGIGYDYYFDRDGNRVATEDVEGVCAYYVVETWSDGDGTALKPYYFFRTYAGDVYQYANGQGRYVPKECVGLNVNMVAVRAPDGEMRVIVSGDYGAYCVDGEDWTPIYAVDDTKGTGAVCFMQNRVFLGEKPCKLLYSNPEFPWDFTQSYDEGGYVYLPLNKGNIVDMVAYGEWLYVFFQYGIVRVKPDGLARNFQVEEISYSGGEIFGGTVGLCGNWVFFLSKYGVCRFDGRNVEYFGKQYGVIPVSGGVCARATVGEYYVVKYRDEMFGDRTFALRADGKDGYFLSNYVGMNMCNNLPLCSIDGSLAILRPEGWLPMGEEAAFDSGFLTLDGAGRKHVKSVTLYGEGCIVLSVICGEDEKSFDVEDMPQKCKLDVGMRGEDFRLKFVLGEGAKVRRVVLEYERLD